MEGQEDVRNTQVFTVDQTVTVSSVGNRPLSCLLSRFTELPTVQQRSQSVASLLHPESGQQPDLRSLTPVEDDRPVQEQQQNGIFQLPPPAPWTPVPRPPTGTETIRTTPPPPTPPKTAPEIPVHSDTTSRAVSSRDMSSTSSRRSSDGSAASRMSLRALGFRTRQSGDKVRRPPASFHMPSSSSASSSSTNDLLYTGDSSLLAERRKLYESQFEEPCCHQLCNGECECFEWNLNNAAKLITVAVLVVVVILVIIVVVAWTRKS